MARVGPGGSLKSKAKEQAPEPAHGARRWLAVGLFCAAAAPPLLGAVLNGRMIWAGAWDRATLIGIALCVAASAILVGLGALVSPRADAAAQDANPADPPAGVGVALLMILAGAIALLFAGGAPFAFVGSVCDLGFGPRSLFSFWCRERYSTGVMDTMAGVGLAAFVLSILLLRWVGSSRR